jgi:tRNA U34 2-thiouridine synthase MnmA/TrmU
VTWVDGDPGASPPSPAGAAGAGTRAIAQCSAHGRAVPSTLHPEDAGLTVRFSAPQRRVAAGQTVALYDPDHPEAVIGSGIAG